MNIKRDTFFEILRFGVVGVIATAIHYGVYYLLHDMIDVNLAYTTGYVVSFVVNYLLSARYTFKKQTSVKNGIGFMGAHAFNYLLQVSLLNLFMWLGVDKTFAPIPVYCVAIPTNFLIVRFVFHRK
ncbi:MAG: GtrA family protein [Prevotellaceae bacterium]|nr:GtrA family protein [Prevotellaceae bacterium]